MGWATSKKDRFEWREFSKKIDVAAVRLRRSAQAKVRHYTAEEIAAYIEAQKLTEASRKK